MAEIKAKCGRCGREFNYLIEDYTVPRYVILKVIGIFPHNVDLCDSCTKDFKKFIEGGVNNEQINN